MSTQRKTASVVVVGWIFVIGGLIGIGSSLCLYRFWAKVPAHYQVTTDPNDFIGQQVRHTADFFVSDYEAIMSNPHPVPCIRVLYIQAILRGMVFLVFGIGLLSRREQGRKLCMVLLLVFMLWNVFDAIRFASHGAIFHRAMAVHVIGVGGPLVLLWWLVSPAAKSQFRSFA